jgi:hypothetical protein
MSNFKFLSPDTHIQIVNNEELTITDCTRILGFDEVMVRVETHKFTVSVFGKDLRVNDYLSGGIVVHGNIENIEFNKTKQV